MNGKNAKAIRRLVRRNKMKLIHEFLKTAQEMNFTYRVKLAWQIVRGK